MLGLSEKDFEHAVLKKRLNAKKSLRLTSLDQETKIEDDHKLENSTYPVLKLVDGKVNFTVRGANNRSTVMVVPQA